MQSMTHSYTYRDTFPTTKKKVKQTLLFLFLTAVQTKYYLSVRDPNLNICFLFC